MIQRVQKILKQDLQYSEQLRKIDTPPNQLYVQGNVDLLNTPSISIIGSRNCSKQGAENAYRFAYELAKQQITITSGMAIGIDTAAHLGCLEAGGNTIAVLPSGFDWIYPKENRTLYEKILEDHGLLVTEYKPDTLPNSNKFLERNRIVSGLSLGTLVIEAEYRSGTSVTARLSKMYHRKVLCVPGDISNKKAVGTNHMIRQGAILVTNVEEIIEEFPELTYQREQKCKKLDECKTVTKEEKLIPSTYQEILNFIGRQTVSIEKIYQEVHLPIHTVNSLLTLMEMEGYVKKLPGNNFKRLF